MNSRTPRLLVAFLLLGLGCISTPLLAADCQISTAGINFTNAYDPTSGASVTGNGSITVKCSYGPFDWIVGFPVTTSLSQGTSGTFVNRTMRKGAESLMYNLYIDPAFTTVFGDGTAGTSNFTLCYPGFFAGCSGPTGTDGQPYSIPVYGRLPGGQDVSAGTYADSITAKITF